MSTSFTDQVVIVTGAAGHIGAACAEELARQGAIVGCLDVADPAQVVERIAGAGGHALGAAVDLRDEESTRAAAGDIATKYGRIDALINMAGIFYGVPRVPFWEIDVTTWNTVIESNLRSAFLATKAVSGPMRTASRGRIVNVSSSVAAFGMANFLHYGSAKAGIVGMTRGMARELGPFGIAVNAIAPGLVHTKRTQGELSADYLDSVVNGQCLRTPIKVDDVVNAVLFLASEASRVITGQTLLVNGGAAMGAF